MLDPVSRPGDCAWNKTQGLKGCVMYPPPFPNKKKQKNWNRSMVWVGKYHGRPWGIGSKCWMEIIRPWRAILNADEEACKGLATWDSWTVSHQHRAKKGETSLKWELARVQTELVFLRIIIDLITKGQSILIHLLWHRLYVKLRCNFLDF